LVSVVSASLKEVRLAFSFGDREGMLKVAAEILPRHRVIRRRALGVAIREKSTLWHLREWGLDLAGFDWDRLRRKLDDRSSQESYAFLAVFFGSFRTALTNSYVRNCLFCDPDGDGEILFSTTHLFGECPVLRPKLFPGMTYSQIVASVSSAVNNLDAIWPEMIRVHRALIAEVNTLFLS
jgi:hypothetical protein